MKNKVTGAIVLVLGLLVSLSPRYILPVCEWAGKKAGMICGYTGRAEIFVGVIIASIGIGVLLSSGGEALRWLMLVALVSGVTVLLIPQVIGYCPSEQMPCNYGAVPMLRLLGGLLTFTSIAGIIIAKPGPKTA